MLGGFRGLLSSECYRLFVWTVLVLGAFGLLHAPTLMKSASPGMASGLGLTTLPWERQDAVARAGTAFEDFVEKNYPLSTARF